MPCREPSNDTSWEDILRVASNSADGSPDDNVSDYVRFDEIEDFIGSLELAAELSQRLDEKPAYWKWVCQAAHAALQGAMVRAVSGTAQFGALEKKDAIAWAKWFEERRDDPSLEAPKSEKLADFKELLKRIQKPEFMGEYGGDPINVSDAMKETLLRFHNEVRNGLVHFRPMAWSIEIEFLRQCIAETLDLLNRLTAHPSIEHRLNADQRSRITGALSILRQL